jgi:hypothetical protein
MLTFSKGCRTLGGGKDPLCRVHSEYTRSLGLEFKLDQECDVVSIGSHILRECWGGVNMKWRLIVSCNISYGGYFELPIMGGTRVLWNFMEHFLFELLLV